MLSIRIPMGIMKKKFNPIHLRDIGKEKQTRIEIIRSLSDITGLTNKEINSFFLILKEMIFSHLGKKGSGEFIIPMTGIKLLRVKKKSSKSRKFVSPLTGDEVIIPSKPKRHGIKLYALKHLRESVY